MYSTLLFRSIGGYASVISGLLLGIAHLINLLGGTNQWNSSWTNLSFIWPSRPLLCFYRII